jgi:DNA-binding XRE family transcriptional regulator
MRNAESLGACLKAARLSAGYTIAAVSVALGINRTTLFRHENGDREPDMATLETYCALYDAEIAAIGPGRWAWKKTRKKLVASA